MDHLQTARMFKALGDPTRLNIFQFLRGCCHEVAVGESGEVRPVEGPTVGEVCCQISGERKITTSMSFHLKELRLAGLIQMDRRGKNMICRVDPKAVEALSRFFLTNPGQQDSDCC